jgi:phenylpropionate dioxygenase-like ring-hydroxylating dioxygenase large terminal subunit
VNSQQAAELIARLSANLRNRTQDLGQRVEQRAVGNYADPQTAADEHLRIFSKLPLLIGHASQAPDAGDFFTVGFAGPPLLVVRQHDGNLRGFINVCRHRGAMLTTDASGHKAAFVCPYHGWRYELDGRLASMTARECFPGVDRATHGLVEVPLDVCEGLVFAITTPGTELNARQWLGPVGDLLGSFALATHRHFRTEIIETRFNWKIGVEGSLETYHFRDLHSKTIAPLFDGMATAYDNWPPHQRQCVAKPSLVKAETGAEPLLLLRDQILQIYFIFPCTLVSVTNDHFLLTFFYPRGIGGCSMVYTMLTPEGMSDSTRQAHWERTWKLTRSVLSEDFAVQESIQRAAEAGSAASQLVIGLAEGAVARFHETIDHRLRG